MAVFWKLLLLALFVAAAAVNLIGNYRNSRRMAAAAKPLLMPLLVGLSFAAGTPDLLVVTGLACGFLGDVLLLWQEKKPCFMGGLLAFLAGHVCYCIAICRQIGGYTAWGWIAAMLILLSVATAAYFSLQAKVPGDMKLPVIVYLLALVALSFMSANLLVWKPTIISFVLLFGSLSFFASDYILARGKFDRETPHHQFWVMLTYIAAQSAIGAWALFR